MSNDQEQFEMIEGSNSIFGFERLFENQIAGVSMEEKIANVKLKLKRKAKE